MLADHLLVVRELLSARNATPMAVGHVRQTGGWFFCEAWPECLMLVVAVVVAVVVAAAVVVPRVVGVVVGAVAKA